MSSKARDPFWEEKVALIAAGDILVTERHGRPVSSRVLRCARYGEVWHYIAHPPVLDSTVPARHLGCYGDTYAFRLLGSGEVVVSNDVWTQGVVPAAYVERLPINATELHCTCRRNLQIGDERERLPRWPVACEMCEAIAALTEEVRHG